MACVRRSHHAYSVIAVRSYSLSLFVHHIPSMVINLCPISGGTAAHTHISLKSSTWPSDRVSVPISGPPPVFLVPIDSSLDEARAALREDKAMRSILGEELIKAYLAVNKVYTSVYIGGNVDYECWRRLLPVRHSTSNLLRLPQKRLWSSWLRNIDFGLHSFERSYTTYSSASDISLEY